MIIRIPPEKQSLTTATKETFMRVLALALTSVLAACIADPAFAYANPDRGPYPQPCSSNCYRSGSQKIQSHQKHQKHLKKSERALAHEAIVGHRGGPVAS
jgi:hypothetical protein